MDCQLNMAALYLREYRSDRQKGVGGWAARFPFVTSCWTAQTAKN